MFIARTDAEADTSILWPPDVKNWLIWKDPDAGKDWRWEKMGDERGWEGWKASPTQWTWVWASSGSWWWTGRPDVLQSMGSQRFRHDWVIELNWTDSHWTDCLFYILPYCLCKHIENTNVLKSSTEIIVNFYKSDQLLRHCCKAVVSERQAIIK